MGSQGFSVSALEGGAGSPRLTEGVDAPSDRPDAPERSYQPGELAPYWSSPYPNADLSDEEIAALKSLSDLVGNKDVAARRWEVEQAWEARLFDRGYQYLLPRKGGGWILPPFATDYNRGAGKRGGMKWYGYETNIYETYGEIITAALTRDIPRVRFSPSDPNSDDDITAADAANRYGRVFARNNDLFGLHHQLVYYLRTDGRAVISTDFLLDAQRWGYEPPTTEEEVAPEVQSEEAALFYLVRHGETQLNAEHKMRGRSEAPLDQRGQDDVERAVGFLRGKGVAAIVTSPVMRSRQSGEAIAQALGVPLEIDERIASLDLGEMAGKEQSHVDVAQYRDNPEVPMPGGESFGEFEGRVKAALFDILRSGQRVAVVTHDSVISCAVRVLEGASVPATNLMVTGGVAGVFGSPDTGLFVRAMFPASIRLGKRGRPVGQEHAEVFGKLEAKVPINAQCLRDCPFVQVSREYDYAYVRAMFPDKADQIRPGAAGAGENELDRIARINASLALEASYVTGDSMVRDCTVQRTWFRPGFFMEVPDKRIRALLLEKFPDGCLVVFAGEAFIFARNEALDDHLTLIQAFPGSGMNRLALCSKLLSIQKRVNNWIDLLNDYFIRTIPQRYVNNETFDVEALNDQSSVPGVYVPYVVQDPTRDVARDIWVEPTPTHQPSMPEFIHFFLEELPQLVSGALPTLFGSESNTDTVGGAVIQRDQALGRLSTPWHNIQVATCSYFRQAVKLAAMCRTRPVSAMVDNEAVRIDLADMKGNVLVYPESEANFPESWVQKQARYQMLLTDAINNPVVMQMLSEPSNLRLARDMVGISEFNLPAADSYDKQCGEIEKLVKTQPLPNAAKIQALDQAEQMGRDIQTDVSMGVEVAPERPQLVNQAVQAAKEMPDEVSSVPVDPYVDNHAVEMRACLDWLNKPVGRKLKSGSAEERRAYENVRLHMMEHRHYAMALSAQQAPAKPPSITANLRDMPAEAAASVLTKQGLPATAESVEHKRIEDTMRKRAEKMNPKEF